MTICFNGTLKPFQERVVQDMIARRRALLAYPMGSGKTVISLAAIEQLMLQGVIRQPGIILAGASLKYQWQAEIEKFTDSKSIVVAGTPTQRKKQYAEFRDWERTGVDYLIVTYTTLTNDIKEFLSIPRGFVIADECIALKSPRSKRTNVIKEYFRSTPVRFGLSGTPIENGKPEELFTQMSVIDPTLFGDFYKFDRTFINRNKWGGVDSYRNLPLLHKVSSKAVFHRPVDDPDIASEMPEEVRMPPVVVSLSPSVRKVYAKVAHDIEVDLRIVASTPGAEFNLESHYTGDGHAGSAVDALRGMLMSKITVARMLCDHPDLVRHSAEKYFLDEGAGSSYAAELHDLGLLDKLKGSPKLDSLCELADTALADPKAKLVVFSVYRGMLDIISDALPYGSITYHGGLTAEERQRRKIQFQTDPDVRIFISSDAGGMGVDLPQANCLINYDMPWQAGALEQRNARPRRVSSDWSRIVIEQLLVKDTIEEWQLEMLQHKAAVSKAILEGKGITEDGGLDEVLSGLAVFLGT